jgi:hypothetical protein
MRVPRSAASLKLAMFSGTVRCPGATRPKPSVAHASFASASELEGGGRAIARPPPQSGEVRYTASAAA